MNVTMTREEIRELLGVNEQALKQICKRNTLEQRLELVGFKLISKEKMGRNVFYQVEEIKIDKWAIIQNKYSIRKEKMEAHTRYCILRLLQFEYLGKNRVDFIRDNALNIPLSTAKRWDDVLVGLGAIQYNGTKEGLLVSTLDSKNVVYRMLNGSGEIIYIGKSSNLKTRIVSHSSETKENDWFLNEVAKIEYVSFKEYGDCSLAEVYFIMKNKPKYNKDFMSWNSNIILEVFESMRWANAEYSCFTEAITIYERGEKYDDLIKIINNSNQEVYK